jgi:hypothetical protein
MSNPIFEFTSHVAGKNAKVQIWPDRVEWERAGGASGAKISAGVMTMGLSLLATGVKSKSKSTEMIPVKSITSVSTQKDGFSNTLVKVVTAGAVIDFRVSHKEAAQIKAVLNELILRGPAPLQANVSAPESAAPDAGAQLTQLAQLRDAGILTAAEFDAKKAEILSRM